MLNFIHGFFFILYSIGIFNCSIIKKKNQFNSIGIFNISIIKKRINLIKVHRMNLGMYAYIDLVSLDITIGPIYLKTTTKKLFSSDLFYP